MAEKPKNRFQNNLIFIISAAILIVLAVWLYPRLNLGPWLTTIIGILTIAGLMVTNGRRQQKVQLHALQNVATQLAPWVSDDATRQKLTHAGDAQTLKQHISQALDECTRTGESLGEISSSLSTHIQSIHATSEQMDQNLSQQKAETLGAHEQLERLNEALTVATRVADDTIEVAQRSETEGNSGKVTMTNAMGSVMALAESVNETGNMVETLGKDSEAIRGIVNVIKSVAEQTNLLALNAAIEAARAGEQGRGFAVVADEVRSLANKTQESAQEIQNLIGSLLDNVSAANEAIHGSMKLSEESDELIEGVVTSYSEIVGYMSEVNGLAQTLTASTIDEQQTAAAAFEKLKNIEDISANSAEHVTQMSSSSDELQTLSQQLLSTIPNASK